MHWASISLHVLNLKMGRTVSPETLVFNFNLNQTPVITQKKIILIKYNQVCNSLNFSSHRSIAICWCSIKYVQCSCMFVTEGYCSMCSQFLISKFRTYRRLV